jgi:hypothetical protein
VLALRPTGADASMSARRPPPLRAEPVKINGLGPAGPTGQGFVAGAKSRARLADVRRSWASLSRLLQRDPIRLPYRTLPWPAPSSGSRFA